MQTEEGKSVPGVLDTEEDELVKKVAVIEEAHVNQKHGMSWKLVNEISGRNSSQTAKIRRQNAEERVKAWHTHFKNLLGRPPEVDG